MSDEVCTPAVPVLADRSVTVNQPMGTAQILPSDSARLVLLLTWQTAGSQCVVCLGGTGGTSFQFQMTAGTNYEITWAKHGPLVQRDVWVITSALGTLSYYAMRKQ